jgi:O-glycosyl hydrolase
MKTKMKTKMRAKTRGKTGLAALAACLLFMSCEVEADRKVDDEEQKWTTETGDPIEPDWESFTGRTVFVNPATDYQELNGFGASDCWVGNWVGKSWNDVTKEQIAEWLFSQDFDDEGNPKGIGLSQWRVNLGAGSYEQGSAGKIGTRDPLRWERRAECFLKGATATEVTAAAAAADPSDRYDWTKQAGQQYFFKKAKDMGTEILIAFSNSPLFPWTKSGTGNNVSTSDTSPDGSGKYDRLGTSANLKDDCYDDFAGYMADVAEHFAAEGYPFDFISPVNEPQWDWNEDKQEGTPWNNGDITKIVKELDSAIQGRAGIKNKTKIMIPESTRWDDLTRDGSGANQKYGQIDAFFNPANTATYVGNLPSVAKLIAGHTYWTHDTDAGLKQYRLPVKAKADSLGVDVYNTEWCLLGNGEGLVASTASAFDIALYMAKLTHSDITVTGVKSWSFWTAMDYEGGSKDRYTLIGLSPGVSIYDPNAYTSHQITESGSIQSMPTLWALGNYSLFVRPGFKRIGTTNVDTTETDNNNLTKLMATSYKSPAGYTDKNGAAVDRIVTVYVNWTTASHELAAIFTDGRLPVKIRCFRTDAANTNNGGLGMRFEGHNNGVIVVPPRSVYTVVYDF